MEDTVAARLKLFIEKEGISSSQFADSCGIPRPSLSQLLTGRNKKISDIIIGQIHYAYPQLSVLWLLFGEGDMYGSKQADSESQEDVNADGDGGASSNNIGVSDEDKTVKSEVYNGEGSSTQSSHSKSAALIAADYKNIALMKQIESMKKNPRRVVQITIYYDDSTFETFVPGK